MYAAERMDFIPFSSVRSIFEKAAAMEKDGIGVLHLEIGRPDFDTPRHIKDAAKTALDKGLTQYTSNYGILPLRQAIARKLERENHLDYCPESEVLVTSGVSEGIMISMMALLNPGDEVLIPDPALPCYAMAARMAGAVPVSVPASRENGYRLNVGTLQTWVTRKTRMLVIVSPGNPSGEVLDRATMQGIADFAIENDLLVLSDEIYEKFIYGDVTHTSIASLAGMRGRTITLNGFSKSYAMTGWRLGYLAADASIMRSIIRIHQYAVVCSNSIAQWAGVAALEGPQADLYMMVEEMARRRRLVLKALRSAAPIGFPPPDGAMYVYLNVENLGLAAHHLADLLLEQARVAVVPWDYGHIRISYAANGGDLPEAMHRITECMRNLSKEYRSPVPYHEPMVAGLVRP